MIPDAAVRVLLLDFDTLPEKTTEAEPIVRFRLRKSVPFDADQPKVTGSPVPIASDVAGYRPNGGSFFFSSRRRHTSS